MPEDRETAQKMEVELDWAAAADAEDAAVAKLMAAQLSS